MHNGSTYDVRLRQNLFVYCYNNNFGVEIATKYELLTANAFVT